MERDVIYVKGRGLLEVQMNDLEGTAIDSTGVHFVRVLEGSNIDRWMLESEFFDQIETPTPFPTPKNGTLHVDYGIKENDPLTELIHSFKFEGDFVFQYQVHPESGNIEPVLVAMRKKNDIMTPDASRVRVGKHYRGRKR